VPKGWAPSVVPGARTSATPLLSTDKVIQRLQSVVHEVASEHYGAFYSLALGGIVTDPAFMMVHMDDHMVHRGHSVFDTVLITDGHAYLLEEHVARFLESAEAAGLPVPKSEEALMRIILDTAAASRKLNCIVKFWVSAGRGGFGLSTSECIEPGLYAMATSEIVPKMKQLDRTVGFSACTSTIPCVGPHLANVMSTNYLRNALALLEAQAQECEVGLFVDEQGHVLEGPNMNLAIITHEGEMVTPPFEGCLAGVTIRRVLALALAEAQRSPDDVVLSGVVSQRHITVADLMGAREAFLTGSNLRVMPLVMLDGEIIGDGQPGITTLGLDAVLLEDMKVLPNNKSRDRHIPVPYGFLTGMPEQLV